MPADDLLAALAGEPAHLLRQRAISREIDRAALSVGRWIANHRAGLGASRTLSRCESLAMEELCRCLANYRELGLRLVGGRSAARCSS
jgi:hypothetical protein